MRNFQKSQAKKTLTALGDARRSLAVPPAPSRAELARRQKVKRAREKALASALTKAGLDLAPLRALKPARQDPLRQWRRHTASVAKQSALAARTFRRTIDKRRALLEDMPTLPLSHIPGLRSHYVLLDTPFLMTRSYGMLLDDSNIEPWNSWAKVRAVPIAGQSSGSMELSFYHLWQNTSDTPVSVDAHSYLVLNGGAVAYVYGGIFPDDSAYSNLAIDVRLYPWEWWNQPPTSPLTQPDQSQNVMTLHQGGSGWIDSLAGPEQDVFRGYDLSYHSWAVPPNAFAVFETAMSFTYSFEGGSFLADFSGESQYSVMSAAVLLFVTPSWGVLVANPTNA
jgi:hypothetical protein